METGNSIARITRSGVFPLVVMLVAVFAAHQSALGATTKADCDALTRTNTWHKSPVEALTASPVDHGPIEQVSVSEDRSALEVLEVHSATDESATPYLYLTPRVASVLRAIFDTAKDDVAGEPIDNEREKIVLSPVAEVDKDNDSLEFTDDVGPPSAIDGEVSLPLLQRQMLRTDI